VQLQVLQILKTHMEVATQTELHAISKTAMKLSQPLLMRSAVVGIAFVGMRRGDHMLNAVSLRHAAHFEGNVPGFGAIVNARKNMRMNIEQDGCAPKLAYCSGAARLRTKHRRRGHKVDFRRGRAGVLGDWRERLAAEDFLQGDAEDMGHAEGYGQGRGIFFSFDGDDGLAGYADFVGEFLLGHFGGVEAEFADVVPNCEVLVHRPLQ
jgi:hypothetical protein